jgi:phosphate transport system substrate-binding protein
VNTLSRRSRLVAGALALALVAAACGGDDSGTTTTGAPSETTGAPSETTGAPSETTGAPAETTEAPSGGLSGSIFVTGSSTVEPITSAVAKRFSDLNPGVAIAVEGPGTGDGFAKFCNGEADVSDASRPIKAAEVEKCEQAGVEFIELKVAIDGLSVITSAQNEVIECLSFADLWVLLGPDATGRNTWSDANDAAEELRAQIGDEAGAITAPYPDAPLTVTAPGEESGTYDSFVEIVFGKVAKLLETEEMDARPDYVASPNDNVIVEGIASNPTSLGWVGFAFVEENLDRIKPLQVDGGKGCVEPTPETIAAGEFPIARDLYIYVSTKSLESNPALEAFIDFYVSDEGLAVIGTDIEAGQVPYVPMLADDVAATRAVWEARETGTRDGG